MQADVVEMGREFLTVMTTSTLVVSAIQWLKNTKLVPFVNQHSSTINRILSWVAALLSGAGIHYNYEAATGTLTLTGLTLIAVVHAFGDTAQSYAAQSLIYRGLFKERAADVSAVKEGLPAKVVVSPGVKEAGEEAKAND